MSERLQTERLRPSSRIRPTAQLQYRNYQSESPDGSGRQQQQLASALSEINPKLQSYLQREQERDDSSQLAAGSLAFTEHGRRSWADAVKEGLVDEGANPFYRRGYLKQELRLKGLDYAQALNEAYMQNPVRSSDDPEALRGFMHEFNQSFFEEQMQGYDPELINEALVPRMQAAEETLFGTHRNNRNEDYKAQREANTAAEISKSIEVLAKDGQDSPEAIAEIVSGIMSDAEADGMLASKVNELVATSIMQMALSTGNEDYLDALDGIQAGNHSLADRPAVQERVQRIRDQFQREREAAEAARRAEAREAAARAQAQRFGQILSGLLENPHMDLSPQMREMAEQGQWDEVAKLHQLRSAVTNNLEAVYAEDPFTVSSMFNDAYTGNLQPQDVLAAVATRDITQSTAQTLYNFLHRTEGSNQFQSLRRDPLLTTAFSNMEKAIIREENGMADATSVQTYTYQRHRLFSYAQELLDKNGGVKDEDFYTAIEAKTAYIIGEVAKGSVEEYVPNFTSAADNINPAVQRRAEVEERNRTQNLNIVSPEIPIGAKEFFLSDTSPDAVEKFLAVFPDADIDELIKLKGN